MSCGVTDTRSYTVSNEGKWGYMEAQAGALP